MRTYVHCALQVSTNQKSKSSRRWFILRLMLFSYKKLFLRSTPVHFNFSVGHFSIILFQCRWRVINNIPSHFRRTGCGRHWSNHESFQIFALIYCVFGVPLFFGTIVVTASHCVKPLLQVRDLNHFSRTRSRFRAIQGDDFPMSSDWQQQQMLEKLPQRGSQLI